jgi:DNA polymerase-3 subunit beta
MKFTAKLSEFSKLLQKVVPAVPPKSTLPILEHLKFDLKGNILTVVATDQDISILSSIEVGDPEEGGVLVPARMLNDIVKALDNSANFTFISDVENYEIKIITSSGNYSIKGLNPDEYIQLPELFENEKPDFSNNKFNVSFPKGVLQRLANKTSFAISTDEYRPSMNGALFQFRNNYIYTVATDSFRLVRAKSEDENYKFEEEFDVLVPLRMMEFLRKIDEEVKMSMIIGMDKITHVRVDYNHTVIVSRVIDEKFPPYESVIPSNINAIVTLDSKIFLSALKRVSLFASSFSKLVKMRFENNEVYLFAVEDSSGNFAEEKIPCEYTGEKIEVGFNWKNLEEIVANIDSNETDNNLIELQFVEPIKPVLVMPKRENPTLLSLIMPIRY